MAKAIFSVLLKFIKGVVNTILAPINLLVVNLVPDLSSYISTFTNVITSFLSPNIAFFAHLLPPITRSLVIVYLTFLIVYYGIVFTLHALLKVFHIIKEIKIW